MDGACPHLELTRPVWFLVLAALPLVVYYSWRSLTGFSRLRHGLCLILRVLLLAALTAALSDPRLARTSHEPLVVFAVDRSRSIADSGLQAADAFIVRARQSAPDVSMRCVAFAAEPAPLASDEEEYRGDRDASDLAAAIETACGLAPPDCVPGVVLLSDGNQTVGEALRTAHAARAARVPVSTVPLETRDVPRPVLPPSPPRALLIQGTGGHSDELAAALREARLEVELRAPDGLPATVDALKPFRLVVLANMPAAAASKAQMEAVLGYVRDLAGGLIVIGGDRAFTAGEYSTSPLEEALPVRSEPRDKDRRPSVALVLVVDRSLSMAEGGAIELAKEAMRRAVEMLDANDQLGLLAFDEESRWVSPIGPCGDKAELLRRIGTLTAGGRTDMYPAIEKAFRAIDETFAEVKHIVVLTDGIGHPGDYEKLLARIARSGTTLSTVALGREASRPLLQRMAELGRGHFYACDDAAAVPKIFAIETAGAVRRGIREKPFSPRVVVEAPFLAGVDVQHAPPLLGYVETQREPGSKTVLAAEGDDPLLVWRRYGRGTCVAFTSDADGRWSAAWMAWPGFRRFWAQIAREVMRPEEPPAPPPDPDPSLPAELRARSTNHKLLRQIAEITGGQYNPDPAAVVARSDRAATRILLLWPCFVAAAAAIFVLDVAARRRAKPQE